nr:hypothetical protein [uncultured Caldimonas sp.]
MASILPCPLPEQALLRRYGADGAYTDCYVTALPGHVTHADYVEAFYTTRLFKLERWVLSWLVKRPSTDAQARELALGTSAGFAAWSVEAREPAQVLLCDLHGRTRSWLMVAARDGTTQLFFGSAVVPLVDKRSGRKRLGFAFHALMGFHKLYSRLLLSAAAQRLQHARAAA